MTGNIKYNNISLEGLNSCKFSPLFCERKYWILSILYYILFKKTSSHTFKRQHNQNIIII